MLCLVAVASLCSIAFCQEGVPLRAPFPGKMKAAFKWDSAQGALIFYRDVTDPNQASVVNYGAASQPQATLSLLKDFPDASEADVWDVAGAPGGGIVLAAVLRYGATDSYTLAKSELMLLTYDRYGKLTKAWNTYPFHVHKIVVDNEGDVYAFGERIDRPDKMGQADYPIFIEYSPRGKVLRDLLNRSAFPMDSFVVEAGPNTGDNQLLLVNDSPLLYVGTTQELFRFGDDGAISERIKLHPLFQQIAAQTGMSNVQIVRFGISDGQLVAQLRLRNTDSTGRVAAQQVVMARLDIRDPSHFAWDQMGQLTPAFSPGAFLGLGSQGRLMFMTHDDQYNLYILAESPEEYANAAHQRSPAGRAGLHRQ